MLASHTKRSISFFSFFIIIIVIHLIFNLMAPVHISQSLNILKDIFHFGIFFFVSISFKLTWWIKAKLTFTNQTESILCEGFVFSTNSSLSSATYLYFHRLLYFLLVFLSLSFYYWISWQASFYVIFFFVRFFSHFLSKDLI